MHTQKIKSGVAILSLIVFALSTNVALAADLLTVNVDKTKNGTTVARIVHKPGAGIDPLDESKIPDLVTSEGIVDLFGTYFDPGGTTQVLVDELWPGGPIGTRFIFEPVTLRPNQQFFGLIGIFAIDGCDDAKYPDGYSEEQFRNEILTNYEVEVNGVAYRGDNISVLGPVGPINLAPGVSGKLTHYDYAMRIPNPGRYHVTYRAIIPQTVECGIGPEISSFEFTIDIVPKPKKDDDDDDDDDD